ncbi:MAG: hypothetical protein JWO36_1138 [Myxococcales bacterium]|nr:hypothetical protein [Myxococcales bacterium]
MQRTLLFALALAVLAIGSPAGADHKYGRQVRYAGIHPVPKSEGGGICYIEGPHVHIYTANKLEFRDHGGDHVFVGDPVAYGWDGPKYSYKGAHPIHVEAVVGGDPDVEYCYIEGPHYHYFTPADDNDFRVVGDTYFYVAEPPRPFIEARPAYVGINAYYRPITYARPVVTVDAPSGWIGARAEFMTPGVVVAPAPVIVDHRGGAIVEGGVSAEVHIPLPSVHIGVDIGGPPVIVHDRGPVIIHEHDRDRDFDEGHKKHKRK